MFSAMNKLILILVLVSGPALAQAKDSLIETARSRSGDVIPYVLTRTSDNVPRFAVIVMPGGEGTLSPEMRSGEIWFRYRGNFLIRSRALFADDDTVTISTDSTGSEERMGAIVRDVALRYPGVKVYIMGTSRSTLSTMRLADSMDGQVAGFIHTASNNGIARFNTRQYSSRHLLVHHEQDECRYTQYSAAQANSQDYGTELVTMRGGRAQGDVCEAFGYHGFNGIEPETVEAIKSWMRRGTRVRTAAVQG